MRNVPSAFARRFIVGGFIKRMCDCVPLPLRFFSLQFFFPLLLASLHTLFPSKRPLPLSISHLPGNIPGTLVDEKVRLLPRSLWLLPRLRRSLWLLPRSAIVFTRTSVVLNSCNLFRSHGHLCLAWTRKYKECKAPLSFHKFHRSFDSFITVLSQFHQCFMAVLSVFYRSFISVLSKFSFVWANPRDGRLAHSIGIHP